MSTIIEKYNLAFTIADTSEHAKTAYITCAKDALFSYHLEGYFLGQSIDYLVEDVLPEINKALSGQLFDSDAGGTLSFLTIGTLSSSFSALDEGKAEISIPTQDLKEIITAWTQWVIANNLQRNIS